jgi:hypothetical protein
MSENKLFQQHQMLAIDIGVNIIPSVNFLRRYDVYKNGTYVCSIGSKNHFCLLESIERSGEDAGYDARMKRQRRNPYNGTIEYFYESKILWSYPFATTTF